MAVVVDLSHPIRAGMTTYPGLPGPELTEHMSRSDSEGRYAPGVTFSIGRISMVGNTGTYLDSPFHRFPDGDDLAAIDPARLVDVPGVKIDATDERAIGRPVFGDIDLRDKAVLIHTGWDRHWETSEYGGASPFLTSDACEYLVASGPAVVGIDSLNIDDTADPYRPAHSILLAAGIPIVEHMCRLGRLPPVGFRFTALAAPVAALASFPVRAVALIDG